jgi:hypothetical protein
MGFPRSKLVHRHQVEAGEPATMVESGKKEIALPGTGRMRQVDWDPKPELASSKCPSGMLVGPSWQAENHNYCRQAGNPLWVSVRRGRWP